MNVADIRKDYTKFGINENELQTQPLAQFEIWINEAIKLELPEPNAMSLATVDEAGSPNVRIVLLKGIDHGLCFYTNYLSKKGKEMLQNQKVSVCFFWPELERQVRVKGFVEKLTKAESETYFQSRPKGSQIGAMASAQSTKIINREVLESKYNELAKTFENNELPLPSFWGGYRIIPNYFEFWQGRSSRLHDRIVYEQQEENQWIKYRLSP